MSAILITAVSMGVLARREPNRRFRVGGRGVRTAEVTYDVWLRRYFPYSVALSVLLIGLGVFDRTH